MTAAIIHLLPLPTLRLRLQGRSARAWGLLALVLPVPLFAALGLSLPLPSTVERIAAELVPFSGSHGSQAHDPHPSGGVLAGSEVNTASSGQSAPASSVNSFASTRASGSGQVGARGSRVQAATATDGPTQLASTSGETPAAATDGSATKLEPRATQPSADTGTTAMTTPNTPKPTPLTTPSPTTATPTVVDTPVETVTIVTTSVTASVTQTTKAVVDTTTNTVKDVTGPLLPP